MIYFQNIAHSRYFDESYAFVKDDGGVILTVHGQDGISYIVLTNECKHTPPLIAWENAYTIVHAMTRTPIYGVEGDFHKIDDMILMALYNEVKLEVVR